MKFNGPKSISCLIVTQFTTMKTKWFLFIIGLTWSLCSDSFLFCLNYNQCKIGSGLNVGVLISIEYKWLQTGLLNLKWAEKQTDEQYNEYPIEVTMPINNESQTEEQMWVTMLTYQWICDQ